METAHTHRTAGRFGIASLAGLALAALVAGCSSSESTGGGTSASTCKTGEEQACACADGTQGAERCVSGAYTACQCGGSTGDAAPPSGGETDASEPADASSEDAHIEDGGADGAHHPATTDAGFGQYMGACKADADCPTGDVCYTFGSKGQFCTHTCKTNTDCAAPSPRCTPKGYCAVPDGT